MCSTIKYSTSITCRHVTKAEGIIPFIEDPNWDGMSPCDGTLPLGAAPRPSAIPHWVALVRR